ncbi:MAG: hypothetical protein ABSE89_01775 [Sedimentisphaerales bacterium]
MKKAVFILVVLFSSVALAQTQEPNAILKLRDSIKQLDMEINHLLKIIELQKKEIEFLRTLCSQAGINVTPTPAGISEPVFGVYLGETLDTLRTRLRVSKSNYVFADKDWPGQVWSVEENEPNINYILAYTFDEQIYEIDIEFADASASKCEAVKTQLGKKYKAVYQNTFETVIDGVNVGIELNCHTEGNNRITLTYIHVPILREMYTELESRKAKESQEQQKSNQPEGDKPNKKKAKKAK